VRDPRDARGLLVALTERRGRAIVDEIAPLHLENEARLLAGLSVADQRRLEAILRRLLISLEASSEPPGGGSP
jgi:DNA-binding MarR family transcriptional regulator